MLWLRVRNEDKGDYVLLLRVRNKDMGDIRALGGSKE